MQRFMIEPAFNGVKSLMNFTSYCCSKQNFTFIVDVVICGRDFSQFFLFPFVLLVYQYCYLLLLTCIVCKVCIMLITYVVGTNVRVCVFIHY